MLVEDLSIVDGASPLWETMRPMLDAALRLETGDDTTVWHGWNKAQVETFLRRSPHHCCVVVAAWETLHDEQHAERDVLRVGWVGELLDGQVCAIHTLDTLTIVGLPHIHDLEPGYEHARAIMRAVHAGIAPVAWAIFTDKTTWDEWLFATDSEGGVIDKSALLRSLSQQGRCVLLGSQVGHPQ